MARRVALAVIVLAALQAAGCGANYFLQAAAGQAEVLRARRPFEAVLRDPVIDPGVRGQLLVADSALVFGRVELGLPRTDSYRQYADLRRPYVVWNVFAAPEFSLAPRQWCFPVAGCVVYRGYFREARARHYATGLGRKGDDVYVGGVAAYSTLGWFADPLLNTMVDQPGPWLAGVLFHELAHQLLHVPGDSRFNEGFASFVEQEGTLRWLEFRRDGPATCRFRLQLARRARVNRSLARLRAGLRTIYGSGQPPAATRAAKARAFAAARADYQLLRRSWPGPPYFDGWFGPDLNNAKLAALASYEDDVPAFREMLREAGGDLGRFYGLAREAGALPPDARRARLRRLDRAGAPVSGPPPVETCRAP